MSSWDYSDHPARPGWYAVLRCFDPEEGSFPEGAYWDGSGWSKRCVIGFIPGAVGTETEAQGVARQNDPDA